MVEVPEAQEVREEDGEDGMAREGAEARIGKQDGLTMMPKPMRNTNLSLKPKARKTSSHPTLIILVSERKRASHGKVMSIISREDTARMVGRVDTLCLGEVVDQVD